jgi:Flp pilus assembly protein TadG
MRRGAQRGVATVEFTIAVPLLLFLLLLIAEFGRAFIQYTVLSNSVRDAARFLAGRALLGTTGQVDISTTLRNQTRNLAVFGNTSGTGRAMLPSYTVNHVTVDEGAANNVTVTVQYPYQALLGQTLPTFGVGDGSPSMVFNMRVVVTMRAL